MTTDATALGWGNPRDLDSSDMVRGDIGLGTTVSLRNDDVLVVMREAVRRLVAAGFRPNDARDDGGYNKRLKRWAEKLYTFATAPLTAWSDHGCGTAVDVDWSQNAYRDSRPGNWRDLTTMPDNTAEIVAPLGLEWGGSWSSPWDPMHLQVAVTPARLAEIAAGIRTGATTSSTIEEDDDMTPALDARLAQIVQWMKDVDDANDARQDQIVAWQNDRLNGLADLIKAQGGAGNADVLAAVAKLRTDLPALTAKPDIPTQLVFALQPAAGA